MFAPGPRGRARARGRDGACGDPMFYYLTWRSLEAIARCWRATRDAFWFEPVGAAATLGVVFGERVARRAPGAIGDAARVVSSAAMCARGRGRGGAAERLRDAALATCSHESDFAVAMFAGSMFAKMAETERRVREAVGTRASAPATVAFALALGMATNAAAAASARALGYGDACWRGAGGLVFALKTYRARIDYARGYRGRVSFFGFIDVPAETASVAEIVILALMDSSPTALNLYGAGAAVGFMVASFERETMRGLACATRGVKKLLGVALGPSVRVGSRVVLARMRNASLNGNWGTVVETRGDQVTVSLDVDGRNITALRDNLIVV